MVKKIHINLSNKVLYTFVTIIVILALGVGVYALAPNPGHAASEVDFSETIATLNADQICLAGSCQTSWPSGGGAGVNNLSVDANGFLCYDTGASCTTAPRTCEPQSGIIEVRVDSTSCDVLQEVQRTIECNAGCSSIVACEGDSQGTCFGGSGNNIFYDIGSSEGCSDSGGDAYLSCDCGLTFGLAYSQEFAGGTRCI